MASFSLKTGITFMRSRWSTVCFRPARKSELRKSFLVMSSWLHARSMCENSRSYRAIRPLCPQAAAARRCASFRAVSDSLRLKPCSSRGLLLRICSRRIRCRPAPTEPDVTRMTCRPLLTSTSICSMRLPILPRASLPSEARDTTCVPTLTTIFRAEVTLARSKAASELSLSWPLDTTLGLLSSRGTAISSANMADVPRWLIRVKRVESSHLSQL
mmetsp:Transcript_46483/g.118639  ORF Transcript_46483/g.118639 Transcript_46483/m.118639 type:complete len:215 (-) Transcript_46483:71-715(-)